MKKFFVFYFALSGLVSFAQQRGEILINWAPTKAVSYGDYSIVLPQFDAENFEFRSAVKQLFFNKKITVSAFVDDTSLQVSNIVYENMSASELGEVAFSAVPTKI